MTVPSLPVIPTRGRQGLSRSAGAHVSYSATILAETGLVGYWRLGEASGTSAADAKGSNTGTYLAGVTLGAAGALVADANTAVTLSGGSTGMITFANPSLIFPWSFEAWVYCTGAGSVGSTSYCTIFGFNSAGTRRMLFDNAVGGKRLLTQTGNGNLLTPIDSAPLNTWLHVAYTAGSTTVEKVYINGVEKASQAATVAPSFTQPFLVGAFDNPATNYAFKGTVDEVALYNVELTPTQVLAHYNAGAL